MVFTSSISGDDAVAVAAIRATGSPISPVPILSIVPSISSLVLSLVVSASVLFMSSSTIS
eukprot:CAMPEP_0175020344 /NCGR_PEP_ID=MMETSP0005-20121125/14074_1 /TAXON_ID=420556 /ORGANISM="Ochromonas sp., Strain CCMP1393" /LENGTH=59 /DNA_ID=CAMNT_0016278205 /DNA_START=334 /DNA_END=509 /DNA_ORIENTATION=-